MNILLTGGAGYIGSHTAAVLSDSGHKVILFDNLANSNASVIQGLEKITGDSVTFVQGDISDTESLSRVLDFYQIDAVFHFAGLKAVGESRIRPIDYYANNVQGTISLLQAMHSQKVNTMVFSSSATVYGEPQYLPLDEAHLTKAVNPYGRTKLHIEHMLEDVAASSADWSIAILRYFNPVGAHQSGLIGENPKGAPNNLMPYLLQVAAGFRPYLSIFGNDYPTVDGTGIRDYIHVMDLAEGHAAALRHIQKNKGCHIFNLGTGIGTSVLELIQAFEEATNQQIKYSFEPRRLGDTAICYANPHKALHALDWQASRTLTDMCLSSWRFQSKTVGSHKS
jgi:UDP-glucose 4-epimerase